MYTQSLEVQCVIGGIDESVRRVLEKIPLFDQTNADSEVSEIAGENPTAEGFAVFGWGVGREQKCRVL